MKDHNTFNPCIPRPVQIGKKTIYVFDTPYFEVRGKRYKLIGAAIHPADVLQTVKNIDTGETKDIPHEKLIEWFSELKTL